MLAIARLLEHRWGKLQVGFIAKHVHGLLIERASHVVTASGEREKLERAPNARYLCGFAPKTMWRDDDRLISVANYVKADDKEKIPERVAYRADGVLELESIDCEDGWAIVERLPNDVTWLPDALARRDDLRERALTPVFT